MLSIKDGVDLVGVTVPMVFATICVDGIYQKYAQACIITTGREGEHSRASLHYPGNALDYRMKHVQSDTVKKEIYQEIRQSLGKQYDVILHPYVSPESPGHLHVEFQPKEKL